MSFPLGKPILVMLAISIVTGMFIALSPSQPVADITLWTFTNTHTDAYQSIVGSFEKEHARRVEIQMINGRAEGVRLESMFMSGQGPPVLPDVVELPITYVGRFFRPPLDEIGLLPLNNYFKQGGWDKRLSPMRVATWSKRGVIFGVPTDIHPVGIVYRKDLFIEAGIDLEAAATWPQFQDMCVKFQDYWRCRGFPTRHAIELPQSSSGVLTAMLLQRGINLVDQYDQVHINEPRVAQTVAFYAQLVAGPRRIAGESGGGNAAWTTDVLNGNLCAFIAPDWRVFYIRTYTPQLAGKVRLMPLPRFDPTDAPTSTDGGTMIGITRRCPNPDQAWKLVEYLQFSPAGLEARERLTGILSPLMELWDQPIHHREDPFFGGQRIEELYVSLARQIPANHVAPETVIAQAELSVVLNRVIDYLENSGTAGLQDECQRWLDLAAADLHKRIERGTFRE